jgi:hypothetical protein
MFSMADSVSLRSKVGITKPSFVAKHSDRALPPRRVAIVVARADILLLRHSVTTVFL